MYIGWTKNLKSLMSRRVGQVQKDRNRDRQRERERTKNLKHCFARIVVSVQSKLVQKLVLAKVLMSKKLQGIIYIQYMKHE